MKKIILLITLFACIQNSYGQEIKHNNFGIGVGVNTGIYPVSNGYNITADKMDHWFIGIEGGKVVFSASAYLSFVYEYCFNKRISASIEPSYIFTLLQFEGMKEYFASGMLISGIVTVPVHQINIPLILNYKFPLSDMSSNFLLGLGTSMLLNMQPNKTIYRFGDNNVDLFYNIKSPAATPQIILRAGYEINTKNKIQIVLQYNHDILESNCYNFSSPNPIIDEDFKKFRVSRFDVEIKFFF